MVEVVVRDEHGVHGLDAGAERLLPEVRPRVDDEVDRPGVGLRDDVGRTPEALVAGVLGGAHPAPAPHERDAGGGPGAEEGDREA